MKTNVSRMFKYVVFSNVLEVSGGSPTIKLRKIFYQISTQLKARINTPQIIDGSCNSEKVDLVVLYGPPFSQSSYEKASPR